MGEPMHEVGASARVTLRIDGDLSGRSMAAVVYGPDAHGHPQLRLNRSLLSGQDFDHVLSWARREIALGKRISWLLADELAGLA